MGADKGLLQLPGGLPMILRTSGLVELVTRKPAEIVGGISSYQKMGLCLRHDEWPGAGPLGGIGTALRALEDTWAMIVACDLPYLTKDWLEFLIRRALASAADAVLPVNVHGPEPLCAMYHKRCAPVVCAALDRGIRKVTDCLSELHCERVAPEESKRFDPEGLLLKNMNSPADYEEAKARLGK